MNRFYVQGLAALLQFQGLNFAAAPPVIPAAGGEGAGAPAPGSGAPPGGTGGAGGGAPASGADGAKGGGGENIAQLRTAYDTLKAEQEAWKKLGASPDEISSRLGPATQVHKHYSGVAQELGYTQEEFDAAYAKAPEKVIALLNRKQGEAAAGGGEAEDQPLTRKQVQELLEKSLKQRLSPLEQSEQQRQGEKLTAQFNEVFEGLAAKEFGADGWKAMDQAERDALYNVACELFKYDEGATKDLRSGKTAGVQKYYTEAKTFLDTYFQTRLKRETKAGGGKPPGGGGKPPEQKAGHSPEGKPYTLTEMVEDPSKINPRYAG